ncbi:MAG: group II truncated hemoglobin [Marinagarivorans sp.]|nr:group II truncated hemoglobin [Marinagarivorans sp.]
MVNSVNNTYGVGDASYRAAGELAGLTLLVDAFYTAMDSLPEAQTIRAMHPDDLTRSRQKLTYFLAGWLGGPKLYGEHFGKIHIPNAHRHLPVGYEGRDAWMLCMQYALDRQTYTQEFKAYLIAQLKIPAERIRLASEEYRTKE